MQKEKEKKHISIRIIIYYDQLLLYFYQRVCWFGLREVDERKKKRGDDSMMINAKI